MTSLKEHFKIDYNEIRTDKELMFQGANYRITVLSEGLIRFEYSKTGIFLDAPTHFAINRNFPKFSFKVDEDTKYLSIGTKYFTMQYTKNKPFKGLVFAPDANLRVRLNNSDKLWYPTHPEARNFKSTTFSLDDLHKIKYQKGLYSTDGFVMIDDSKSLIITPEGHLKQEEDRIDFYLFMYKRDFGNCLKDYYTLTGYPSLIPRYALGIWWNRDKIYSAEDTKKLLLLFKKHNIPISVLLLSEFWHTKDFKDPNLYKTGFTFNEGLFPRPGDYINYLHQRGIRIGLEIDPVEGIRKEEPSFDAYSTSPKDEITGNVEFNMLDNNFASTFLNETMEPLFQKKIDFYWIDYKQDLKQLEALNYYIFNNFKKVKDQRPMLLTRNQLTAAHRYPVLYSGQTEVSFKTLDILPKFNSDSSNIGVSNWSHDVGGFKGGIEDGELYSRYVQFSCFSPIFRFSAKRGVYYKREPWLWDIKTSSIVEKYCQLRHRLIPYLYSENYKYHKNGMPLIMPLYYINPELYDEPVYKNEYYFGSEMLVAPITKEKNDIMNRSVERIFLPKGIWYDFETGKKFVGNRRYVTFYKDENYPVFVKEGGIVPLTVFEENLNDTSNPKSLEINVFPGKNNTYKLYEDDGISSLYKEGYYIITNIDYNYMANNYTLIVHPLEGKTGLIPKVRNYFIKFRNTKKAEDVKIFINGAPIQSKVEQYALENDFYIKIYDVDTTKQLTVNCMGKDIEIDAVRIINEDIYSIINDLKITTNLKEKIANIIFSELSIPKKRIAIRKLKKEGLEKAFIDMFIKLLEYTAEI